MTGDHTLSGFLEHLAPVSQYLRYSFWDSLLWRRPGGIVPFLSGQRIDFWVR